MGLKKEDLPDPKDQDPAGEVEVVEVAPGQKGEVRMHPRECGNDGLVSGNQSLTLHRCPCAQVIRVDDNFEAVEGLRLTPNLIVGKEIGGGAQGAVYDLKRADGSNPKMLLKVWRGSTNGACWLINLLGALHEYF
jgi:hypothetical protein